MPATLSDELQQVVAAARKTDPQQAIPIIVTMRTPAALDELQRCGLNVQHAFESISAVSGTVSAADIDRLARVDQVERIEYDGQAWALPDR